MVYHLYSDGSYFPRAKKSGFGGYIVDPEGQVIVEFSEQIKQANYMHSFELLGIIRGLQIAKDKNIQHIVSHCDDKNTAERLQEIFEQNIFKISPSNKPELYQQIIEISSHFKKIKFEYIPRSQNKYADSLSRRYASLMEENFNKHYEKELNHAQKAFVSGHIPKRIFFSHPAMVRVINRNSPFLVAQHRNKKVRKISRTEEQLDYQHLYLEYFNTPEHSIIRTYHNETSLNEYQFKNENTIENFCHVLVQTLKELPSKNLWLHSNHREINQYFEQKEKIPSEHSTSFLNVFQSMQSFPRIFYHHFEHNFSDEIKQSENSKKKLDADIYCVETLMEQLPLDMGSDRHKCFGNLIRCHLRNYKEILERELEIFEKNAVIQELTSQLKDKGHYNLPKIHIG